MTSPQCAKPIAFEALVAYWLGVLPVGAAAPIEKHIFGSALIRVVVRNGGVGAVITQPFLEHMKSEGMRIREYRLAPGERVACTIRADDDAVVSRMQVALAGVKRVDALHSLDLGDGHLQQWRLQDPAVRSECGRGARVALGRRVQDAARSHLPRPAR